MMREKIDLRTISKSMASDDIARTQEASRSRGGNAACRVATFVAGSTARDRVSVSSGSLILLSRWSFLEVLEYLGSFSILIAVIFYFSESGDRLKQKHYQAWQVINTAQGKGGSGGRIEALQELDEDGVPLVGVDVSGAFLQGFACRKRN